MKALACSFVIGLLFALGLGISGMTQPTKVIGFLDWFGNWDASLLMVMLGAVSVNMLAYRFAKKRTKPYLAASYPVLSHHKIDLRLMLGAAIFGAGWGLIGYCPGPAIVSVATGKLAPLLFTGSMLLGMLIYNQLRPYLFKNS